MDDDPAVHRQGRKDVEQLIGERLQQCVQRCVEPKQDQQGEGSADVPLSTTPLFSNIRSLITPLQFFRSLLDCSQLPALHSLSLISTWISIDYEDRVVEGDRLHELSSSVPLLRRLRLDDMCVRYMQPLLALPLLEHLDMRTSSTTEYEVEMVAPPAPSLCRLLLPEEEAEEGYLFGLINAVPALSQALSLQQLNISARLTNDDLRTLTALRSLTALELAHCNFDDTDALSRLMSDAA